MFNDKKGGMQLLEQIWRTVLFGLPFLIKRHNRTIGDYSLCTLKIHSFYDELFKTRLKDDSLGIQGIICCYTRGKLILCKSICPGFIFAHFVRLNIFKAINYNKIV